MSGRWLASRALRGRPRSLYQRIAVQRRFSSGSTSGDRPSLRRSDLASLVAVVSVSVGIAVLQSTSTTDQSLPDPTRTPRAFLQRQQLSAQAIWLLTSSFVGHTAPTAADERRDDDGAAARRMLWWTAMQTAWQARESLGHQHALDTMIETLVQLLLPLSRDGGDVEDADHRELVRRLVDGGAIDLLLSFVVAERPRDAELLRGVVRALAEALDVYQSSATERAPRLSLVALGEFIDHVFAVDCVGYSDILRLSERLALVLERDQYRLGRRSRWHLVTRTKGEGDDDEALVRSLTGFLGLLSPEMPLAAQQAALSALTSIATSAISDRKGCTRHIETLLSPACGGLLLALPRSNNALQTKAASLVHALIHLSQAAPAPVSHDVYELWMKLIRRWIDSQAPTRSSGLQLAGATCLRAMSSYPSSRHALSQSGESMDALFQLARQLHEDHVKTERLVLELGTRRRRSKDRQEVSLIDQLDRALIRKHVSRAFRNVCTSFQRGHTAMTQAFASSTTIALQTKRELPMSRVFQASSDITDLPVIGADEYESSTEFGWIDILTQWACNADPNVRENAIESLVHLVEEEEDNENVVDNMRKREHILQAWLTSMLQHVRNISGGEELLAVREVERIAELSDEMTPGNEKILFNPAVVDAGTSALAVLAEHHHQELLHSGVVPLMTLLAMTHNSKSIDFAPSCAQVISNLVAACCKSLMEDANSAIPGPTGSSTITTSPTKWWLWRSLVADSSDVERTMATYPSGQRFLRLLRDEWAQRVDPMERSEFFRVIANFKAFRELSHSGRVTTPLYTEGVFPIVPKHEDANQSSPATESTTGHELSPCNSVDVVFVHGLRGHAFGTWRTDMNDSIDAKDNAVWPDAFLLPDLQAQGIDARVITLGYEAGMVSWSSPWPSLTLEERARVMLRALQDARIGEPSDPNDNTSPPRPVIFVTHSMGGLLVKKMLTLSAGVNGVSTNQKDDAPSAADAVAVAGSLAKSTKGVVFLAVPHFGSDLARGVRSEAVRTLLKTHPALQDLSASHDQRLEKLNAAFSGLGIDCLSIAEERPAPLGLGLSALVVKPDSADPGIGEFFVLPGSDHMTICKAKTRDDPMFQRVRDYIQRCVRENRQ